MFWVIHRISTQEDRTPYWKLESRFEWHECPSLPLPLPSPGLTTFPLAPSSPGGPFLPGGPAAPDEPVSPFSPISPLGPFVEREVRSQKSLESPGVKVSMARFRNLGNLGLSWDQGPG